MLHGSRNSLPRLIRRELGRAHLTAVALCALSGFPCCAKQAVYFKTGFSLEVDSYSQQNQTVVFHIGTGTLEFDASQVARIELLPDAPVIPSHVSSPVNLEPDTVLNQAAYMQGLDADFVRSVAKVESGLRQSAVSKKGALGLMQLMPSTAAELRVNPTLASDNAHGGAMYLRDLLLRYRGNSALALAAYNAGPGAVQKFGGVPPYEETRRYIAQVLREYDRRVKARKTSALASQRVASKPTSTN